MLNKHNVSPLLSTALFPVIVAYAVISGTTEGVDCIILVRGEKSITKRAMSVSFLPGTMYVDMP